MKTATAAIWHSDRLEAPFSVERLTIVEEIATDELLLRNECAGICGSDAHVVRRRLKTGEFILGHEVCGIVEAAGEGVRRDASGAPLRVGDRVVAESIIPCMACEFCLHVDDPRFRGNGYAMCPHYALLGGVPISRIEPMRVLGAYAEYIHLPLGSLLHRVAPHVPAELAVLTEPLTVAVKAVRNAAVERCDRVLVLGPGPIGLLTVVALREVGVKSIYLAGTRQDEMRLALGRALGAVTFQVDEAPLAGQLRTATDGRMVTRVIDATGSAAAMEHGLFLLCRGGIYTSLGGQDEGVTVPILPDYLLRNKIELRFSHTGSTAFPTAIAIIESGRYPLAQLVSHRFPLAQVEEAFTQLRMRPQETCKVLLKP